MPRILESRHERLHRLRHMTLDARERIMFDRYDPRSDDGRDRGDGWDRSFGSRGGASERDREEHSRDVFTRDLEVPRGRDREQVRDRDRVYEIDGAESRALATIGAFRVVAESDLHDIRDDSQSSRRSLKHLEKEGLIRTSPLSSDDRAVTLTDRGRDLLEANRYERHDRTHEPRQTFHAGIRKPRELTHDTKVYRSYQRAEERLRGQGGRVRRVVLDYELKRDYQRSCTSATEARRTATAGRTVSPKRLRAGRASMNCPTTMGTSDSLMPASSTRTETVVHSMRILRSSPATIAAPMPAAPPSQDSPAISRSDARSAVAAAADGGPHTRESWRS